MTKPHICFQFLFFYIEWFLKVYAELVECITLTILPSSGDAFKIRSVNVGAAIALLITLLKGEIF